MNDSTEMWAQDEYHFHGQRSDEHVLMVRNEHPIVLLPMGLLILLSLVIPYLLFRFAPGAPRIYGLIAYALILVFYIGYHWYGYNNSLSILSNQRILNVSQRGFFNRQISEAELVRIQDVSTSVSGVLPTMFGFGNVSIRTASESLLVLKNIGDPYDVQQNIVRALKGETAGKESPKQD